MKIISLIPDRKKLTTEEELEEIKRFIQKNILDDEETKVLVGVDKAKDTYCAYQVLVLRERNSRMEWENGKVYQYPIPEDGTILGLRYFLKSTGFFVLNKSEPKSKERGMIEIRKAYQPECPGMQTPLFRGKELNRAETIASALDGLDIYSAQRLLNKMMTYLLLTTFQSVKD